MARGKYQTEVEAAVRHLRFTQCGGTTFAPRPAARRELFGFKHAKVMLITPAGRRDLQPQSMTRHVALDHDVPMVATYSGACPLDGVAERPPLGLPLAGFCHPTPAGGDCLHGEHGSWDTRAESIGSLEACVARCRRCARCQYVSYSELHRDCSWYHYCHSGRYEHRSLQARWAGRSNVATLDEFFLEVWESGWDYRTQRVRVGEILV